jgi:hypothetical protein
MQYKYYVVRKTVLIANSNPISQSEKIVIGDKLFIAFKRLLKTYIYEKVVSLVDIRA